MEVALEEYKPVAVVGCIQALAHVALMGQSKKYKNLKLFFFF